MAPKWVPLEASPDVFNDWSKSIGLPKDSLAFQDLFSLDPEFLQFVPKPVKAVFLLFPSEGKLGEAREAENRAGEGKFDGQGVWFVKQTIGNACGSIGLLHALLNLPDSGPHALEAGSPLSKFKADTLSLNPVERAQKLEEADFFEIAHTAAAQSGQSSVPTDLDDVDHHFLSFIEATDSKGEKRVLEMDGSYRDAPFDRGPCKFLLEDAARIVKEKYMDRADGDVNFTMIVLAGADDG